MGRLKEENSKNSVLNKRPKSTITKNLAKIRELLGFIKQEPVDDQENRIECSEKSLNVQSKVIKGQQAKQDLEIVLEPQWEDFTETQNIRECRVVLKDIDMDMDQFKHLEIENFSNYSNSNKDHINKSIKLRPKIHKNLTPYLCGLCGCKFKNIGRLNVHMRLKHNFGRNHEFICDFDGRIFTNKSCFNAHMGSHRSNVVCEICKLEMKFLSLKDHMIAVHSDKRKYKCHLCPKNFKLPSVLKNHLRSHDKQFECKICGKKVRNGQDLKFHIKQFHENPRSFKCEICEKGFFDKGNLKKHLKTHDKNRDKAYKCDRCSYSSDNKAHYKLHQDYHARWDAKISKAPNPVKCKICFLMLRNKTNLKNHMKSVHPKDLFQCDLCAMFSKTRHNLAKHMRNMHLKNSKNLS
ncbi:hypothetical protein ACKWTF_014960 [Chironomus riparius]